MLWKIEFTARRGEFDRLPGDVEVGKANNSPSPCICRTFSITNFN